MRRDAHRASGGWLIVAGSVLALTLGCDGHSTPCTSSMECGDGICLDGRCAPASDASTMRDAALMDAMVRIDGAADADAGADAALLPDAATDAGSADAGIDAALADAGPATVTRAYRAWVWNVAGNLIHSGDTDTGLIDVAVSSIVSRDADFVGFNELCFSQYRALQAALRDAGWPRVTDNFSRFAEAREATPSICNGTAYGNAIFSREPLGSANRIELPSDGRIESRNLLCAPLLDLPHMRWCTTHVTTSSDVGGDGLAANVRQLMALQGHLLDFHAAGDTVLIGGDFNAQPHYRRLDRFYAPSVDTAVNGDNRGVHRELDDLDARCPGHGERTVGEASGGPCDTGVKIDLLFAREDELDGPYEMDSLSISNACGGPCSDHRIVVGDVTLRVRTE